MCGSNRHASLILADRLSSSCLCGNSLDFSLAALEGFSNETIDLFHPIVSHGVAAD